MKKPLVMLLAASALCSCSPKFTVTGRYDLAPGDSVFLFASDNSMLAAGVIAPDTTFTLEGRFASPDIATLSDRDRVHTPARIFLEPGIVRLAPDPEGGYNASGTPLNDSMLLLNEKLTALRDAYLKMPPETPQHEVAAIFERFEQIPLEMMNANLDNLFGLSLFSDYEFPMLLQDTAKIARIRPRMEKFSAAMQAHPLMRGLQEKLSGLENTQIGSPFTELVLENTEGETVALSSLVGPGRWVLLDFWATWCGACLDETDRFLKQAYADHHAGGFEIYAVSLDNDKARWKKLVAANGMPWTNVLGVDNAKQSDAAARYCVTTLPANFLISPDGVIAAKNLHGEALRAKLAEVMQ